MYSVLMSLGFLAVAAPIVSRIGPGPRAIPRAANLIIGCQCALAGTLLLYCAYALGISRRPASPAFVDRMAAERPASADGQLDVIGDSDFYGPRWTGVRRETLLDRVFLANRNGREELDAAMREIGTSAELARQCELRDSAWLARVLDRLHGLAGDPATHLNDPRTMMELTMTRDGQIHHAADDAAEFSAPARLQACSALRTARGLLDADEIIQRHGT